MCLCNLLYKQIQSLADLIDFICKIMGEYNGFLKIYFGPKLIYLISKPEHCEKVLNNPKSMEKDYLYKFIDNITGHGLMTAEGLLIPGLINKIFLNFELKYVKTFLRINL